jgi:hypothetical protein
MENAFVLRKIRSLLDEFAAAGASLCFLGTNS